MQGRRWTVYVDVVNDQATETEAAVKKAAGNTGQGAHAKSDGEMD